MCFSNVRFVCRRLIGDVCVLFKVDAVFHGILSCVLDKNKQVQKAACSALSTVEELSNRNVLSQKTQVRIIKDTRSIC